MKCRTNLSAVFHNNIRRYAQKEGEFIDMYKGMPSAHPDIETSDNAFRRAYILAQVEMAEGAMKDTRDELAGLGVPNAGKLFEEQLKTLKVTREQAHDGYVHSRVGRDVMKNNVVHAWKGANRIVDELCGIKPARGKLSAYTSDD